MSVAEDMRPTAAADTRPTSEVLGPDICRFVARLGLGAVDHTSVKRLVGRNETCLLRTTTGRNLFVKHMTGTDDDIRLRLLRSTTFLRTRPASLSVPTHLGTDLLLATTVYEAVLGARSAAQLLDERTLTTATLAPVARGIAALHDTPPIADLDGSTPSFPSRTLHRRLELTDVFSLSAAELDAWRLIQRDAELCHALDQLWSATTGATPAPTHCDLRLDQILTGDDPSETYVTDWEEYRCSDPARDPAALLGDIFFRALADAAASINSNPDPETPEPFMTAGSAALDQARPLIKNTWSSYCSSRTSPLGPQFTERVAALVGWHILDRILASAKVKSHLTALDRAIAGIARTILVRPDDAAAAIGL